jgi:hypothetical protein
MATSDEEHSEAAATTFQGVRVSDDSADGVNIQLRQVHAKGPCSILKLNSNLLRTDSGKSSDQLRREYAEDEKYDVRNSEIISSTIFAPPWSMPISIPYETLKVATNGFNEGKFGQDGNLVAEGSFSEVFHGMLADKQIAVKRLKKARSQRPSSILLSKRQFMNELSALTRCPPHENVIRLVGISDDGPELCLAYEFVEGKTLAQHLSKVRNILLYWCIPHINGQCKTTLRNECSCYTIISRPEKLIFKCSNLDMLQ